LPPLENGFAILLEKCLFLADKRGAVSRRAKLPSISEAGGYKPHSGLPCYARIGRSRTPAPTTPHRPWIGVVGRGLAPAVFWAAAHARRFRRLRRRGSSGTPPPTISHRPTKPSPRGEGGFSPQAKRRMRWSRSDGVCTDLINADCVGYTSSPATRELPLEGKPVFIQPRIETVGRGLAPAVFRTAAPTVPHQPVVTLWGTITQTYNCPIPRRFPVRSTPPCR